SAEEHQNFSTSPANAGKSICDNLKSVPADATFVEQEINGETYCSTLRQFSNMGELRKDLGRLGNVTVHTLKLGLGKFVFDVQVDLKPTGDNKPAPTEWRLTPPGEIGKNNADTVEGQTLIWNIESGQIKTLHAESTVGLSVTTWWILGIALLL